jgi:antagonist of KipI
MIEVIKAGVADAVHDEGRFGYQHLGINPGGAMDLNAMRVANALVGNKPYQAVIELHFPASAFYFHRPALVALSGADFSAKIGGINIPLHRPVLVPEKSELKFGKVVSGRISYLAARGGFAIEPWLNSCSTNLLAKAGGYHGRYLRTGDRLPLKNEPTHTEQLRILPWQVDVQDFYRNSFPIRCLPGREFGWLTRKAQDDFQKKVFRVDPQSNRMGFRLSGVTLKQNKQQELISSAVSWGTVQLLPEGELIVLMADHQTTGGYPRVAHVIAADRSRLVQCRPHEGITFAMVTLVEAEDLLLQQERSLRKLQYACALKLKEAGL